LSTRPRRNESIYRKTTLCSPKSKTIDLPSCNNTPTALAVGALVPTANLNGDRTSISPRPQNAENRFEGQGYSPSAIQSLIQAVVHQTGPKSPYRHAQYLFLQ
ncbi:hypothetical protein K450DRAFT_263609, partial [Umbelopsis ramanniana AG]